MQRLLDVAARPGRFAPQIPTSVEKPTLPADE
jgi:hypothetical protein